MVKKQFIHVTTDKLIPYANNPRINDPAVADTMESIRQCENLDPIEVDEDFVILSGHTRLIALQRLGITETDIVQYTGLTEEQKKKYRILANKTNELAQWDFSKLEDEIADLDFSDFSFDFDGIEEQLQDVEVKEDEPPEPPEEPKAKGGDLYALGNHRLICGDSTDAAVIDRLMDGVKAECVFTDPPYNMSADFSTSTVLTADLQKRLENIVDFEPETISWIKETGVCSFYIFTSKNLIPRYFEIFKGYDFNILVWCKDNPSPMTNYTFLPDIEYLLYFSKKGKVWNNGLPTECYKKYYNGNKLEGRKEAGNVHPTIKPLKIIADKIQISSNKDGVVLDLFGGSGSTLIACEQLNRKCYMAELDPHYVDVIIERWENLTGNKAVLLS